ESAGLRAARLGEVEVHRGPGPCRGRAGRRAAQARRLPAQPTQGEEVGGWAQGWVRRARQEAGTAPAVTHPEPCPRHGFGSSATLCDRLDTCRVIRDWKVFH